MKKLFMLALAVLLVTACSTSQHQPEQDPVVSDGLGSTGVVEDLAGARMDEQEAAMREEMEDSEIADVQRKADILAVTFKSDELFSVGAADLRQGTSAEIKRVGRILKRYPETKIQIAGHTDSTGPEQNNQFLSERRAENVQKVLVSQGVDPDRIEVVGFGESSPIADNSTHEGRTRNRRLVISIRLGPEMNP